MTLREEIVDLSEDRLDESVALGIVALATILGLGATATAMAIADKIKAKNWEKAERAQSLERNAWRFSEQKIITSFDVSDNELKTFIIPSEDYLMQFAKKKVVVAPVINRLFIFDTYEFEQFLKETKEILVARYKALFNKLQLFDEEKGKKVEKFLEKKLSVEFYCRGLVAFTKEQKEKVEKMVKDAVKEAGIKKFKFKLLSATYR